MTVRVTRRVGAPVPVTPPPEPPGDFTLCDKCSDKVRHVWRTSDPGARVIICESTYFSVKRARHEEPFLPTQ